MGRVVLIADDLPEIRRMFVRALERDFVCHTATTGDDATGAALLYQPDVITIDYAMPGGGQLLVERLRSVCGARLLLVTGMPLQYVDLDVDERLKKPVSNVELVRMVKLLAERPPRGIE